MVLKGNFSEITLERVLQDRATAGKPMKLYHKGWYSERHHGVFLRVMSPERDLYWEFDRNLDLVDNGWV